MDYSETKILNMLKERPVVAKKEVLKALKTTPKIDVEEAIVSLHKQGYITIVSLMGQDSISLTKSGHQKLGLG